MHMCYMCSLVLWFKSRPPLPRLVLDGGVGRRDMDLKEPQKAQTFVQQLGFCKFNLLKHPPMRILDLKA